jgi:hypothetical protein
VVFIVGFYASFDASNFSLKASSAGVSPSLATVLVSTGQSTRLNNVTVSSVIFDPGNGQFLSFAGTTTYQGFVQQYFNLYHDFVPIYNYLYGLSGLSSSGTNSKSFGYHLDLLETVLNLTVAAKGVRYDQAAFSYLVIGVANRDVCANCNSSLVSNSSCVQVCPAGTYAHTFMDGGRACLECAALVGLKLNDLANGCNCLPGYEVLTQYQCIAIAGVATNCSGTNQVQNGSTCACVPGTYNISAQCQSCPSGAFFNGTSCQTAAFKCLQPNTQLSPNGTACLCLPGLANYSGSCQVPCPANAAFDNTSSQCQCSPNFMNISGVCVACASGQSYDSGARTCRCNMPNQEVGGNGSCACVAGYTNVSNFCVVCPAGTVAVNGVCAPTSCQANQVLLNNSCVCDQFSVKVGKGCLLCGQGFFPNASTSSCDPCLLYCSNCTGPSDCWLCDVNYSFDFTSRSCIPSTGAATVAVRSGFPLYTSAAIVVDFLVNSPASMAIKSRQQLAGLVAIDFSNRPQPARTLLSQNPSNLNSVRVVLDFRGLLPLASFSLTFGFTEPALRLNTTLTLNFNAANAQLTATLPD